MANAGKDLADQIKSFVLSGLADQVNDEVIRRLPRVEKDYLAGMESSNTTSDQTVSNMYYAYTRVSDDFKKIHIDFYVMLGKLLGTQIVEIKEHEYKRLVNDEYDTEKEYQKRLAKKKRKR